MKPSPKLATRTITVCSLLYLCVPIQLPQVPTKIWRYNFVDFEHANEILSRVDASSVIVDGMLEHPGQTGKHCFWKQWRIAYPLIHCSREGTSHGCPNLSFNLCEKGTCILESPKHLLLKYRHAHNKVTSLLQSSRRKFFQQLKPHSKHFWKKN